MKKIWMVLIIITVSSSAYADRYYGNRWGGAPMRDYGGSSAEVRFLLNGIVPESEDKNWDSAGGLDVQMVNWLSPAVGVAASVGVSQWNAREYELSDYYSDSGTTVNARIEGDAAVFPVGLSLLLSPVKTRTAEVTFEAGLRYAFVNSDVTARYDISGPTGTVREEDRIDLHDSTYGLIAMDVAFPVSPYANISLGAGYQFDLSNSDAEYHGTDIGDTNLEASFVRIGFNARF